MLERRNFKPVTLPMARKFTQSIGQALKYLHDHEIIHRDVKLENVMLTSTSEQSCEAKLTDFGLALKLNQVDRAKPAGTLGYAAPEIITGSQPQNKYSDIWSLGCLLYVMLTLQMPYRSSGNVLQTGANNSKTLVNLQRLEEVPDVDQSFKDLLKQMLQIDPRARPTIDEVLNHAFFNC